ncbi:MAG: RUS1 family protein [Candidatus Xenobia bacterium]
MVTSGVLALRAAAQSVPPPAPPPPERPAGAQAMEVGSKGQTILLSQDGRITDGSGQELREEHLWSKLRQAPGGFKKQLSYVGEVSPDTMPVRKNLLAAHAARNVASTIGSAAVAAALLSTHIPLLGGLGIATATLQVGIQNGLNPIGTVFGGNASRKVDDDVPGAIQRAERVNVVGNMLQSTLLAVPGAYILAAPVGSAMQAWSGTIQNSAQAAMEQHAVKQGQMAAVHGTNQVQELVASSIGGALGLGLTFAPVSFAGLPHPLALLAVPAASALDLFFTRRAARALHMDNLTVVSVARMVRQQLYKPDEQLTPTNATDKAWKLPRHQIPVDFGVNLQTMAKRTTDFNGLCRLYGDDSYMLDFDGKHIRIGLRGDDPTARLRAMVQAQLLREMVGSKGYHELAKAQGDEAARRQALTLSYAATARDAAQFLEPFTKVGWNPNAVAIRAAHTFTWDGTNATPPAPVSLDAVRAFMDGKSGARPA